jgi:hypothetical protein
MAIGRQKAGGLGEGGSGGGTSMALVMRYENGEGEVMGCSHFQRRRRGGGEVSPWCWSQMIQ